MKPNETKKRLKTLSLSVDMNDHDEVGMIRDEIGKIFGDACRRFNRYEISEAVYSRTISQWRGVKEYADEIFQSFWDRKCVAEAQAA